MADWLDALRAATMRRHLPAGLHEDLGLGLVRWLGEQLDVDEHQALRATRGRWMAGVTDSLDFNGHARVEPGCTYFDKDGQWPRMVRTRASHLYSTDGGQIADLQVGSDADREANAAFILRWQPGNALAALTPKRLILQLIPHVEQEYDRFAEAARHTRMARRLLPEDVRQTCVTVAEYASRQATLVWVACLLAMDYADRAGYRREWAP